MNYIMGKLNSISRGLLLFLIAGCLCANAFGQTARQRISINDGWRFLKMDPNGVGDLRYDVRPTINDRNDNIIADTKPTERVVLSSAENVLKKWILPTANPFIKDSEKHHRPFSSTERKAFKGASACDCARKTKIKRSDQNKGDIKWTCSG